MKPAYVTRQVEESVLLCFASDSGATLSDDRKFRYHLWRSWGDREHRCAFIGINPSTADERKDDHTIRKCIGFAKRWGFGAIDMINLFAWRSTDQLKLLDVMMPVGPDNDAFLHMTCSHANRVVYAWGAGKSAGVRSLIRDRVPRVHDVVGDYANIIGTLGRTAEDFPQHPLMLAYATKFEPEPDLKGARHAQGR